MKSFDTLLELALREDLGGYNYRGNEGSKDNAGSGRFKGDVTSAAIFGDETTVATLFSKDEGIIAGLPFFEKVMRRVDPETDCRFFFSDGALLRPKDVVAKVEGKTVSILQAERTAINFLSFLSGIATKTHKYTEAAKQSGNTVVLDTRKTLPGYRELSKYAVRVGNGENHRMGLYDMVMIKDNHIGAVGSITRAVKAVRQKWGERYKIEVECGNLADVEEALSNGVDIIMLDNMTVGECSAALSLPHNGILFEASGNMDIEKVKEFGSVGLDYISVGGLTHSVNAFDFSLRIDKDGPHL